MSGHHNWRQGAVWQPPEDDDDRAFEHLYEDDDGKSHSSFNDRVALAAMLVAEVIFLNSHWWEKEWPAEARKTTALCVCTNDVFAWGCADAEQIGYADIEQVYRYWAKDPVWGTAIWAIIHNKQMPQRPVAASIRKAGVWDLDALRAEHGLKPNYYDGMGSIYAGLKRAAYVAWKKATGGDPLPFDGGWWSGWKEYTAAHPDWNSEAWKAEEERAAADWKARNGWAAVASDEQSASAASAAAQVSPPIREDLKPPPTKDGAAG